LGLASIHPTRFWLVHALDDLKFELSLPSNLAFGKGSFVARRGDLDAYLFKRTYFAGREDIGLLVFLGEIVTIYQCFWVGSLGVEFLPLPVRAFVASDAQGIVDA
jgi:hypothetical protein